MFADIKPYSEVATPNAPWVGTVPARWTVERLKFLVTVNGRTLPESTHPSFRFGYVDIGAVTTGRLVRHPQRMTFGEAPSRARRLVRRGDTIISTVRTYLKAVYTVGSEADDIVVSTGFAVLTPNSRVHPGFLSYAVRSEPFVNAVVASSSGIAYPAIAETLLARLPIAIPPSFSEQASIVRFLDHADHRLRRYIRAKQKLIKLLEEQKQVIIHRAVTRGLDANVRLKSSGVEWLGDVPEHWGVVRLGSLLRERGETNDQGTVTFVLSLLRERGVIPYDEKGNIGNKKSEDITRYKVVRPDDIVVNCMNVIIGSVGLSKHTGCLSPVYYVLIRRNERDDPHYLDAVFQCRRFHRSLVRIGNGILAHRMRIPMELLKCELLPLPPVDEQAQIVRAIRDLTRSCDDTIARASREIDLLHEYRTRLIADVVTGKLDVREAAARLPDATDTTDGVNDSEISEEGEDASEDAELATVTEDADG